MGIKNNLSRFFGRIGVRRGYNYTQKNKSFYRAQFKKLLISFIIVLIIVLIKLINTTPTNKAIQLVDQTINEDFEIKEDGKKVLDFFKGIGTLPDKIMAVFSGNNKDIQTRGDYVMPVTGSLYRGFGTEVKNGNIKIFRKGIDILADTKTVKSINEGLVIEAGEDNLYGKIIRIDHGDYISLYGYLDTISVTEGSQIDQGEVIGKLSDQEPTLLHLEVWQDNQPIDPLGILHISLDNPVLR